MFFCRMQPKDLLVFSVFKPNFDPGMVSVENVRLFFLLREGEGGVDCI